MLKGSHTIEAALIMPIIFSGILGIIYLTLYLYDYSLIEQSTYLAAFRGSNQTQNQLAIGEEVEKQGKELITGKLLWKQGTIKEVETQRKQTIASYEYSDNFIVTKEVTHFRPVNQIRTYRKLEKLVQKEK